jgi:hypothetical protein
MSVRIFDKWAIANDIISTTRVPEQAPKVQLQDVRVIPNDSITKLLNTIKKSEGRLNDFRVARDIAINVSPVSAALAKQLMWDGMNTSVDSMIMTEGKLLPGLTAAPDSAEGVRAFFEKRSPLWRSRVSSDIPVIPK